MAGSVVVIGGANIDLKARSAGPFVVATSNPGTILRTPGGVGRNIAENLARLGRSVTLVTAVGSGPDGAWLLDRTEAAGVDVSAATRIAGATGTYAALLDAGGELVAAVADMVATDLIGPDTVDSATDLIAEASLVVLDGNLAVATLGHALELAARLAVPVVIDPVSVAKAARLTPLLGVGQPVLAITPNVEELAALAPLAGHDPRAAAAELHARGVGTVWVRRGARGSLLSTADGIVELAAPPARAVDVTGAGDAMLAAYCHRILDGASPPQAAAYAHRAGALTVASPHTVRPDLREMMAP